MSSMQHFYRHASLSGLLLAGVSVLAGAAPLAAMGATQTSGTQMVARAPAEIEAAITRWEFLQEKEDLSFNDYAMFAAQYPEFPRMEIIRRRAEAALVRETPAPAQILRFFDAAPPLTNRGRASYALALSGAGRPDALVVARAAWRGGRMSDAAEAYLLGLHANVFTAEDHAARMDALLWQGDVNAAARQMAYLPASERDLAMARLALLRGSLPNEAGLAIPDYAMRNAGYVFNRVNYLRAQRDTDAAIRLLANRPAFDAPAFDAEEFVGDMLAVAKAAGATSAVQIASRSDDLFAPGTDVSKGSFRLRDRYTDLMWLGGTKALWEMGDGAAAAPLFLRYGQAGRTPLTRSKGFYWAGRAARQAGLSGEAERYFEMAAEFPHYYYGQLAIEALRRPMPAFAPVPNLAIGRDERAAFEQRPLVQAIRAMANNRRDWRTERRFFEAIGESADTPEELAMTNQLAAEVGMPEMAVVVGMEAGANAMVGFERIGFPTYRTPRVNDWTMVHAIGRQESEFDKTRQSHAGARGLMQLMPGTAREQAGKLGMQYMSASLFSDTDYNIRLGDAYFARMMDYYGGAYPLAVGAYNAGPGRVNQWLRLNGDPRKGEIDWVTWIEKIPANFETRYYIMRVLGNAVSYSHMYPEEAGIARPIDAFLP
ncbi:MAG: lytic transglycosylase domain-containing protein [Erythrobacter sp.]|jgi:soluble lytic murein transglycosylase|nr:lytic transglycosylase domain-containing protein [Erythrobacter sp.]